MGLIQNGGWKRNSIGSLNRSIMSIQHISGGNKLKNWRERQWLKYPKVFKGGNLLRQSLSRESICVFVLQKFST